MVSLENFYIQSKIRVIFFDVTMERLESRIIKKGSGSRLVILEVLQVT